MSEDQESFYSLEQSKTDFTFVAEAEEESPRSNQLVKILGIKQSSALDAESSQNEVNQTMQTIVLDAENQFRDMELHDISGIDLREVHQLECSACLEKEINCLSVPPNPSSEDFCRIELQIATVTQQQSMLRRQIEVFQGLLSLSRPIPHDLIPQLIASDKIMKKKCEHSESMASPFNLQWPDPNQVSIKTINQPKLSDSKSNSLMKHYDIKPPLSRTPAEEKLNYLYKQSSFQEQIVLLEDKENEYRIEVTYLREGVSIEVVNYAKGQTNYIYAGKLNEGEQKISQKLFYPLTRYIQKKFTISLNILLLFFESDQAKTEQHLMKIEDVRSVSVPLPLCYLAEVRFGHSQDRSFLDKIENKMHMYEIDINYGVDKESLDRVRQMQWLKEGWVSLKGSSQLIRVQIEEFQEVRGQKRAVFRVGTARKDSQEAVDLIEYLCFMLTL